MRIAPLLSTFFVIYCSASEAQVTIEIGPTSQFQSITVKVKDNITERLRIEGFTVDDSKTGYGLKLMVGDIRLAGRDQVGFAGHVSLVSYGAMDIERKFLMQSCDEQLKIGRAISEGVFGLPNPPVLFIGQVLATSPTPEELATALSMWAIKAITAMSTTVEKGLELYNKANH